MANALRVLRAAGRAAVREVPQAAALDRPAVGMPLLRCPAGPVDLHGMQEGLAAALVRVRASVQGSRQHPRFDPLAVDALCFVPATREAYLRRGFDHMELVARELSWLLELPLADVLVRAEGSDQRKLGREDRARNLADSVEVLGDVADMHLLLVDDVITTGASVAACAAALDKKGAKSVTACALARVW